MRAENEDHAKMHVREGAHPTLLYRRKAQGLAVWSRCESASPPNLKEIPIIKVFECRMLNLLSFYCFIRHKAHSTRFLPKITLWAQVWFNAGREIRDALGGGSSCDSERELKPTERRKKNHVMHAPLRRSSKRCKGRDPRRLYAVPFFSLSNWETEAARCPTARETGVSKVDGRAAVPLARSSLSITVDEKRKGLRAV